MCQVKIKESNMQQTTKKIHYIHTYNILKYIKQMFISQENGAEKFIWPKIKIKVHAK